ncbi:MAG TPA: TRAP transporter small permease [Lautropia sp.]|nr:TRAP transporter small permease [Lautropia sp.]
MRTATGTVFSRMATLLERLLDGVLAVALAVMLFSMLYQVFGRYVLGHAPGWSEELARYLMVWLTMLGSASVLRSGGHISVTTLTDRLGPRALASVLAVRDAALVATSGVLAWWGVLFSEMNGVQESAAMEIPMSIPYAALPAGAVLIVLMVLLARLGGRPIPAAAGESF